LGSAKVACGRGSAAQGIAVNKQVDKMELNAHLHRY
jgi:hypothetical protein